MPLQGLQKVGSTAIPAEAPRVTSIMQLRIRERIKVGFLSMKLKGILVPVNGTMHYSPLRRLLDLEKLKILVPDFRRR